jgi:uncharacterized protein YcsI (UPF0317 family)
VVDDYSSRALYISSLETFTINNWSGLYLPSIRTVRTSALINIVALKHAASDAKLGGDPVVTTDEAIVGVAQQWILFPFK